MNYAVGSLLYMTPFHYPDGKKQPEPKYFLVLRHIGDQLIVASLPSSQEHFPSSLVPCHGCNTYMEGTHAFYMFEARHVVTDAHWSFPLNTYVYPWGVRKYERRNLTDLYKREGKDHHYKGRLLEPEFLRLVGCLASSEDVPRSVKQSLLLGGY